jgi:hypothetical protein
MTRVRRREERLLVLCIFPQNAKFEIRIIIFDQADDKKEFSKN